MSKQKKTISTKEFDRLFDEGSDEIDQYVDWESARAVNPQPKRINVDLPPWMLNSLDHQAAHLGITRQSLIKVWLAECIEKLK
jgi:hypothetical protein